MSGTIIFDIDGTLVDSNYQHALAWYRALRRYHAGKLGVPTFAVRTGGFSEAELCGAGAIAVYDSLSGLQADLGRIIARNLPGVQRIPFRKRLA
jgi:phosphoglycolate phosphatase-like HAD superfamily hydrolase